MAIIHLSLVFAKANQKFVRYLTAYETNWACDFSTISYTRLLLFAQVHKNARLTGMGCFIYRTVSFCSRVCMAAPHPSCSAPRLQSPGAPRREGPTRGDLAPHSRTGSCINFGRDTRKRKFVGLHSLTVIRSEGFFSRTTSSARRCTWVRAIQMCKDRETSSLRAGLWRRTWGSDRWKADVSQQCVCAAQNASSILHH